MRQEPPQSFPSRPWLVIWLAALVLLLGGRLGLAAELTRDQREHLIARAEQVVKARAYASGIDFEKRWPELLEKRRERIENAPDEAGLTRVINRALSELGISHIELVAPAVAKDLHNTSFVGIGIRHMPADTGVRIVQVFDNAPADKAGLRVGDVIIEVDGQPYAETDQIRGQRGTKVRVKVRRDDGSEPEFSITRDTVSIRQPETLTPLGSDANMLVIPTFSAGYDRENVTRLIGEAKKAPHLIIDLRSNGGGDFNDMMHLLSCLLPPRTAIGTQVSRKIAADYTRHTGQEASDPVAVARWAGSPERTRASAPMRYYEGKIAVLINAGSASASEIVSAALRELRGAKLIGTQTAGAVLVSTYVDVGDNFLMKVPLSEWVTIKGQRLEGNPLIADVRAYGPRRGGDTDTMPEFALDAIRPSR